jgi:hypothetical protein
VDVTSFLAEGVSIPGGEGVVTHSFALGSGSSGFFRPEVVFGRPDWRGSVCKMYPDGKEAIGVEEGAVK